MVGKRRGDQGRREGNSATEIDGQQERLSGDGGAPQSWRASHRSRSGARRRAPAATAACVGSAPRWHRPQLNPVQLSMKTPSKLEDHLRSDRSDQKVVVEKLMISLRECRRHMRVIFVKFNGQLLRAPFVQCTLESERLRPRPNRPDARLRPELPILRDANRRARR